MDFRNGNPRIDHAEVDDVLHAVPVGIPAGKAGCPRGGADRHGHVEIGEHTGLLGKFIETWGLDDRMAVATEVPAAHVIHQDEDDVQLLRGLRSGP